MNQSEIFIEKLKTSEFRDIQAEKLLIAGMLKYTEVLRKCAKEVREDVFSSDRCRNIYKYTIEFYNKENIVFDTSAFSSFIESRPQSERTSYLKLWKSIVRLKKKVKRAGSIALVEKLYRLYQGRLLEYGIATTMKELQNAINGGSDLIEVAKKKYIDMIPFLENKKAVVSLLDPFAYYETFKAKHIAIQKNPSLLQAVPTGLEQLDEIIGGLRPSEFGLVTAATGVGKSIMLGDFAFHCWKVWGDVLYVTIEMPSSQLSERIYCRMSGIDYSFFRKYKLDEEHWKILDRKVLKTKDHDNKFHLLDIPQSCQVKSLKIEIEEHIRRHGEPRLIVIDYMNIIHGGFDWTKQLEIAVDIKQQIARYFKIATWSANQLMGAKHETEHVKISNMAFAKNICDNIDLGIGIGLTDMSEDEDMFNIDFTKTRDFKGKSFTVQGDRSKMTFAKSKQKEDPTKFKKKENKIGGKITV